MNKFMRAAASKLRLKHPESCADGTAVIVLLLVGMFFSGCTTIDYSKRVRAPASEVEWVYVSDPGKFCRQKSATIGFFDFACTIWPDAKSLDDPDPANWRRAIAVVPLSEKDNPGYLSEHEQGHLDGFGH